MVVLLVMAAMRSKTVKSMTVLALSFGLIFGEEVGESGMIIGLVGEFGGVDSSEEVIWGILMVRGILMFSDSRNGNGIRINSLVGLTVMKFWFAGFRGLDLRSLHFWL